MKSLCRERSASLLAYADSLPVPIKNSVLDKMSLRKAILAGEPARHIDGVFAHEITARVELVFLSGVDAEVFARSRTQVRQHSAALGAQCVEVPFFYGTNMPRIRGSISDDRRLLLRNLLDTFLISTAPTATG